MNTSTNFCGEENNLLGTWIKSNVHETLRTSSNVQIIFWTSDVRWIYVLCPVGREDCSDRLFFPNTVDFRYKYGISVDSRIEFRPEPEAGILKLISSGVKFYLVIEFFPLSIIFLPSLEKMFSHSQNAHSRDLNGLKSKCFPKPARPPS